jgi:hypothetical protein
MIAIKNLIGLFALMILLVFIGKSCEPSDPYAEGMHFDYHIECENGFVYKIKNRAAIQVLNSDGTPLKCGHKIY